MSLYVHVCKHISVLFMHICIYIHITYIHVNTCIYGCICIHEHRYALVYITCMYVYKNIYFRNVYVCTHVYIYMYPYMYLKS